MKLFFVTSVLLIALVAGFPDMQKDLKKVMAGEMEIVVNEEKSVLLFLLSSIYWIIWVVFFFHQLLNILPRFNFIYTKLHLEKYNLPL